MHELQVCPFCGDNLPIYLRPITTPHRQCPRCGAPFPTLQITWPDQNPLQL